MSGNSKLDEIQFYLNILESSGKNIVNRYVENIRTRLNKNNLSGKFEIITNEEFYNSVGGGESDDVTFPYAYFKRAFDMTLPNTKNDINPENANLEHDTDNINHESDSEDSNESESDNEDSNESESDNEDSNESESDSEDSNESESDNEDSNESESENVENINSPTLVDSILKYEPVIIDTVDKSPTSATNEMSNKLPVNDSSIKSTLKIPTNYTGVISILVTIPYPNEEKQYVIEGGITQLNQFINNYQEGQ